MITIAAIKRATAEVYGVTVLDIESARQSREFVYPRWAAMWLARQYTQLSPASIGRHFGDRDTSTVRHALKHFDPARHAEWLDEIKRRLRQTNSEDRLVEIRLAEDV